MIISSILNNQIILTLVCVISIIGLLYVFHKAIEVAILKYAHWLASQYEEFYEHYIEEHNK